MLLFATCFSPGHSLTSSWESGPPAQKPASNVEGSGSSGVDVEEKASGTCVRSVRREGRGESRSVSAGLTRKAVARVERAGMLKSAGRVGEGGKASRPVEKAEGMEGGETGRGRGGGRNGVGASLAVKGDVGGVSGGEGEREGRVQVSIDEAGDGERAAWRESASSTRTGRLRRTHLAARRTCRRSSRRTRWAAPRHPPPPALPRAHLAPPHRHRPRPPPSPHPSSTARPARPAQPRSPCPRSSQRLTQPNRRSERAKCRSPLRRRP